MREYAYGVASGVVLAAFAWWWIAGSSPSEPPAAAVRQGDGSLVLERKPDAKAKPAAQLPARAKLERQIQVVVQPERADCPVCTVDLSLVRLPDDTRRVVASSPTGQIIGGLDVPVIPSTGTERRWLAGALYNGRWGGLVAREVGPFVVGGAITNPDGGAEAWGILAIRF